MRGRGGGRGRDRGALAADEAEWFMDYWNADGSFAEMCGNGARVFVRYLLDPGSRRPARRAGGHPGRRRPGRGGGAGIAVDVGPPRVYDRAVAAIGGVTSRCCGGFRQPAPGLCPAGRPRVVGTGSEPVTGL